MPGEALAFFVKAGRKGGKIGGKARVANMTPEQLSEANRKAVQTRWAKAKSGKSLGASRPNRNRVNMNAVVRFHKQAELLRESSGSTNIEKTLLKALKVLKLFNIPHYVCGGFAVQEHGYPRFTLDADIIVPDVDFARGKLFMNGFKENPGSKMTIIDRETKVEIDLLPGGGKLDPGPLTLPMPTQVSDQPQVLTLERLISSKLSTYIGRGIVRAQDYADVVKLIQVNRLSRDFGVEDKVRDLYRKIWDELHPKKS